MDTFNPNQMPPMPGTVEKKSVGPLIAVIIILALIIVGGLYFLKERSSQEVYVPPAQEQSDPITESLNQQSSSDELNSIETDLNSTNIDNLDQGAAAIDAQIQ
jgi:uncharacterized protein HemX